MEVEHLILDTNVLWETELCQQLTERITEGKLRVFVPTLIHAERIRQVADQYEERFAIDVVRQYIKDSRFELLPLSIQDAEAVAEIWLELRKAEVVDDYWDKHRFDIVLCAIARATGHTLITEDRRGNHFQLITNRKRIDELQKFLSD